MCITTLRREYCGKRTPTPKSFFDNSISEREKNDNSFGTKGIGEKREENGGRVERPTFNVQRPTSNVQHRIRRNEEISNKEREKRVG
jgi:hypothetical protein